MLVYEGPEGRMHSDIAPGTGDFRVFMEITLTGHERHLMYVPMSQVAHAQWEAVAQKTVRLLGAARAEEDRRERHRRLLAAQKVEEEKKKREEERQRRAEAAIHGLSICGSAGQVSLCEDKSGRLSLNEEWD